MQATRVVVAGGTWLCHQVLGWLRGDALMIPQAIRLAGVLYGHKELTELLLRLTESQS